MKKMWCVLDHLKKIAFPPFCAFCKVFLQQEQLLCTECQSKIRPLVSKPIQLTSHKKIMVHAVGAYDQPLVSLILAKSRGNRAIARDLGQLLWEQSAIRYIEFDYIVPIPLYWSRYAWRGYNQAQEIARVISIYSQKPIINAVVRCKRTAYQSHFKGAKRFENLQSAFSLDQRFKEQLKNKKVILVDDVITSGATIREAAKQLLVAYPAEITAAVIARVG